MLTLRRRALHFVVLMGIVSLFADMVYEGGRSISGPYMALLGASGTVVGLMAGVGELIAYGLRIVFGYLSDHTRRYWAFTIAGYGLTALAVPALALAGSWQIAVLLLTLERVSKALRSPAKDTLLAYATKTIGHGKGFGLHEALDQIGAVAAPLLLAAVLAWQGSYELAFALLLIPGGLSILALLVARARFPQPEDLAGTTPALKPQGFERTFWLYLIAVGLIAAGFADFPLIAFHLQRTELVASALIPVLYALAMAVDAGAALLFGLLFDQIGYKALTLAALLSLGFAPMVFSSSLALVVLGMVLWGIGLGAQESILRAAVATMVPAERRGTAYGLFNASYGMAWFLGSAILGLLYDRALPMMIAVSVGLQVVALGLLIVVMRWQHHERIA
ncbi:MFS transporter [Candidatus Chloroploca sp. Khr17]|uniref:MFS transporter n=1 Tax=Candidatus Chloroploca sp. Khr17 TaxID=2496869 RepID=UPI00101D4BDF|nr:MFS transporter [Candidatus Chloroploca sp. Khr17]